MLQINFCGFILPVSKIAASIDECNHSENNHLMVLTAVNSEGNVLYILTDDPKGVKSTDAQVKTEGVFCCFDSGSDSGGAAAFLINGKPVSKITSEKLEVYSDRCQFHGGLTAYVIDKDPKHDVKELVETEEANTYYKLAPNAWIAKCPREYERGEVIQLTNKYGKEADVEVHKLIGGGPNYFYYSFTRMEGMSYAERRAEKYRAWQNSQTAKSNDLWAESNEGAEFLSLAEPIKIGHHSERRHRALIERNHSRMDRSMEASKKAKEHQRKAEYWAHRANDINLSMPESLEYFKHKLDQAVELHRQYKDKEIEQEHNYSMSHAKKEVNKITKSLKLAERMWG